MSTKTAATGTTAGLPRFAEKRTLSPWLVSSISVKPRSPIKREYRTARCSPVRSVELDSQA